MDDVADYNARRWKALAGANALFTRPLLDLTPEDARARVDPDGRLGDLSGARVLLVGGGGGQQSAAFALLGSRVTVTDLSEEQLERDRAAAAHYGFRIEVIRADMRDLSPLPAADFDIVWQPYSINFVPGVSVVFAQVTRVIRPGGTYHLQCANPFAAGLTHRDWNGVGYLLRQTYLDGAAIVYQDQEWVYRRSPQAAHGEAADPDPVPPPREYRHTLATVINGLVGNGFVIEHFSDRWHMHPDPGAEAGTWDHFVSVCPPWLSFWTRYRPDLTQSAM